MSELESITARLEIGGDTIVARLDTAPRGPAGPAGATDHGALTGLADDDHPQYHTDARGDARYSPLGHTHTAFGSLTLSGNITAVEAQASALLAGAAAVPGVVVIYDGSNHNAAIQTPDLTANITLTTPAESGTLATLSGTETLTSKTINSFTNYVEADAIHREVRNDTGTTIPKGVPVYASGYNVGQDRVAVQLADATSAATMPAIGLTTEAIPANSNGSVESYGLLTGVNTSSWASGDLLWVAKTPGGLTNVAPADADLVQPIAVVLRANPSTGTLLIHDRGINDLTAAKAASLYATLAQLAAKADKDAGSLNSATITESNLADTSASGVFLWEEGTSFLYGTGAAAAHWTALGGGGTIGSPSFAGAVTANALANTGNLIPAGAWAIGTGWTDNGDGTYTSNNVSGFNSINSPTMLEEDFDGHGYLITFDIIAYTSGAVAVFWAPSGAGVNTTKLAADYNVGDRHAYFVMQEKDGGDRPIIIRAQNGFVGTIGNIKLKRIA